MGPYSHSPSTADVTTLVSIFFLSFDYFLSFIKLFQEPVHSHALLPILLSPDLLCIFTFFIFLRFCHILVENMQII